MLAQPRVTRECMDGATLKACLNISLPLVKVLKKDEAQRVPAPSRSQPLSLISTENRSLRDMEMFGLYEVLETADTGRFIPIFYIHIHFRAL